MFMDTQQQLAEFPTYLDKLLSVLPFDVIYS